MIAVKNKVLRYLIIVLVAALVASFINHKRPEYSLVWLIFLINIIVALISFFAYGMDYVPVILCIVYSFVTTRVDDTILKGSKSAAKYKDTFVVVSSVIRTYGNFKRIR